MYTTFLFLSFRCALPNELNAKSLHSISQAYMLCLKDEEACEGKRVKSNGLLIQDGNKVFQSKP